MDAELATTTPPERSELDLVPARRNGGPGTESAKGAEAGIRKRAQVGEAAATEVEAP